MSLVHWSRLPLDVLRDRVGELRVNHKPCGLWVSDESEGSYGWREWCSSEMPGWLHDHVYAVELAEGARILRVDSLRALDRFHREWSVVPDRRFARHEIDWPRVAEHYDGILIAPYQWERRLDGDVSDWYYTWDCASGCIWRARAIVSVTATALEVAA